ncbi:DUF6226 family protein [Nocardioides sp.]|uniref:DUF6226 family protein n=1 Tax=Nocardioides sp. TaxID=35761 RepID=UPI002C00E728|nr:DUF6226 family protein [Nocardioides sp.]HSX67597.1 DUF6226 family protein [Nocardioides sp.]
MGTFNWDWANGGPPDAAYSRVTRDLAAVCADFVAWLDRLPGELGATYDCSTSVDGGVTTITPSDRAASPLRLERREHDGGGTIVVVGFGRQCSEWVTDCLCDACDGDSAEFIEAAEDLVAVVTGGFDEFRRDHEEGYLAQGRGGASSSGPGVTGEFFEVTWTPWRRR